MLEDVFYLCADVSEGPEPGDCRILHAFRSEFPNACNPAGKPANTKKFPQGELCTSGEAPHEALVESGLRLGFSHGRMVFSDLRSIMARTIVESSHFVGTPVSQRFKI